MNLDSPLRHRSILASVPLLLAVLAAAAAAAPGARLLREGPDGFTVRITVPEPTFTETDLPEGGTYLRVAVPGYGNMGTEATGRPDLPQHGFPFGIPDGARAEISYRVLSSTTYQGLPPLPVPERSWERGFPEPAEVETYRPDPAVYGSGSLTPDRIVTLGGDGGWRFQRVQAFRVSPVQVRPATGEYTIAREIEVEVRFHTDPSAVTGPRVPVGKDAPGWDALMDETLVNPASSRGFRTRAPRRGLSRVASGSDCMIRVRIGTTGFVRLSYEDLAAEGWPSGVAVQQVRVEERGFDRRAADPFTVVNYPRIVEDNNQNGVFDAGDDVSFYGFQYDERFNTNFSDNRYSYFHCYWVTPSGGEGRQLSTTDGYPEGEGYQEVPYFREFLRFEEEIYYVNNPRDAGSSFYPFESSIFWVEPYETDGPTDQPREKTLHFDVPDPDPDGSYVLEALWEGISTTAATRTHIVSLEMNQCDLLSDHAWVNKTPYKFVSDDLPSSDCLENGDNFIRIHGRTDQLYQTSGAYFDWFQIHYDRKLQARNDLLRFSTEGYHGKLEFAVTGFTSPNILIADITDPDDVILLQGRVEQEGSTYTLRIRTETRNQLEVKTFLAVVLSSVHGVPAPRHPLSPDLGTKLVERGLPRDLLEAGAGSDYILITHPEFEDAFAPLVAHREAQGHRVFVCNVIEIYDQFAGGDKTPWAIRNFLTQAYRTWDPAPSFLCLGGDASEDYRADNERADPDWVPTMMHFNNVTGPGGLELAATDNWYVCALREGDRDLDYIPEMHVGRLPVGSVEETQNLVQKILDYESMDPGDQWRNRALLIADDQYSTSITFNTGYCYKTSELAFRKTTEAICDSITTLGRLPDFHCIPFFLDAYLDTVQALGRTPGDGDCPTNGGSPARSLLRETSDYTRDFVTPQLVDLLSQGHLLVEFTGHANKNLIATESLLMHRPRLGLSSRDMDRVNNLGKPFLFMGYACHLNEFEHAWEGTEGESIGEVLLLAPNRGSIASVASTGYEWLHTNPDAQFYTTRPLFWDMPRDPDTGRPRRLLGEAMTRGLVANAAENGFFLDWNEMLRTYLTLGDPALVIDVTPADLEVTVNGISYETGTPLIAGSFEDTLEVEAVVTDDVDVSSLTVRDGDRELSEEEVTVVPPGEGDRGAQTYTVSFRTRLRLGTYDIRIDAADWSGRTSQFVLPVVFDASAYADGRLLDRSGSSPVDSAAVLRWEVTSPVPLTESNFSLVLDGLNVEGTATPLGEDGRSWALEVSRLWAVGQHVLELRVADPSGGEATQSVTFFRPGDDLTLLNVFFYPNPYEEAGSGGLYYTLNQSAERGRLSIYTVRGRRVLGTDLDAFVGTNRWIWDLEDESGDQVANGVYLFVLELTGTGGKTLRHIERVAVTR